MKLLVKLLLSLYFVLSGGYNNLYAHANQHNVTPQALKTVGKLVCHGTGQVQDSHSATLHSTLFYAEHETAQIIATENEDEDDEELNFLKKASSFNHYFSSYLRKQHLGCYIQNANTHGSLGECLSFLSTCMYITLCVMRI